MSQEPIRFFLPGPAYVLEEVRQALTRPLVSHRSPSFREVYDRLALGLPKIFRTRNEVFIATGSSTLVLESAVISTVQNRVLNLTNGAFSERWHEICQLAGKEADRLAVPWGEAIDPEVLRQTLRRRKVDAVTVVHNETSTGVVNPLAEIARVVREESDALLLVDAVSSLGGAPFETDEWHVDVVVAGAQKAFALPPGLTLFTVSERALSRAAHISRRGYYTDFLRYRDKHRQGGTITTPAIPIFWALDLQVQRMLEEGVEARWSRHRQLRDRVLSWAEAAGFGIAAMPGARSWTVSCLRPRPDLTAPDLVRWLEVEGMIVASGYGPWKAETFRIGHMGEVRRADVEALLITLDRLVSETAAGAAEVSVGSN